MAATVATPLERQLTRIAGVTEMTSTSTLGTTVITLQFDLGRDIDGAARDVQAAIAAARTYLPANLPADPTYRMVNPADAPILIVSLTSATYRTGEIYDVASTIIAQRLSQIPGVGQVTVGGASSPAIRVEVDPVNLASNGLSLADVRAAIQHQNTSLARGQLDTGGAASDILMNGQIVHAEDYKPPSRDPQRRFASATSRRSKPAEHHRLHGRQAIGHARDLPRARRNIIDTVDRVRAAMLAIAATIPAGVDTTIADRTTDPYKCALSSTCPAIGGARGARRVRVSTRCAIDRDPQRRRPTSLIGTFAVMYPLGYSPTTCR